MTSPERVETRHSLADVHGPWCWWCLEYATEDEPLTSMRLVSPDHLREALLPRRTRLMETFGGRLPLLGTVTTHERCLSDGDPHRVRRAITDEIRKNIELLPQEGARIRNTDDLVDLLRVEQAARRLHDLGIYGLSALLKDVIRREYQVESDSDNQWRMREHQLASLAGFRDLTSRPLVDGILRDDALLHPAAALHMANWHSNRGDLHSASQLLESLTASLKMPLSEELAVHYWLRKAQVYRHLPDAIQALSMAGPDAYRANTARVFAAMISVAEAVAGNKKSDPFRYLDPILHEPATASWLYRAESWLASACFELTTRRPDFGKAYKLLVAAQYVYVVLGLQGTPHPQIHPLANEKMFDLMPADVLIGDDRFTCLGARECELLREEAIGEGRVRQVLFEDLTGQKIREPNPLGLRPADDVGLNPIRTPKFAQAQYEDILGIIERTGLAMERGPPDFSSMREELLRWILLVTLNGQYATQGWAEAFSHTGKTDILLPYQGRNVLIAECKLWSGRVAALGAIDQLLRYATWRDTRVALIMFNRNRRHAATRDSVNSLLRQHKLFEREVDKPSGSLTRCLFHLPFDEDRRIELSVFLFNLASNVYKPDGMGQ
jgi:hypothetical protein